MYRLTWFLAASAFAFVVCCGRTSGVGKGVGSGGSGGGVPAAGGTAADAAAPDAALAMGGAEGPYRDAEIADGAEARDLAQNDDTWPPTDGGAGLAGDAAADRWGPDDGGAGLAGDAAIDRWGPDARDAAEGIDGCRPITCADSPCHVAYCGLIGDGCGGALDCGNPCSFPEACIHGKCLRDGACLPLTCVPWGSYHYCGAISDGCANDLDCGCPTGWTCENRFCVGRPPVCMPKTCADFTGCGWHDDGCGSTIECLTCPTPGWLCSVATSRCSGPPSICTPWTSCTSPTGDVFCGTIGDGCGGSLQCGDTCTPLGTKCENNVCGNGTSKPPVAPPPISPTSRTDPPPPPPPRCGPPMPPA